MKYTPYLIVPFLVLTLFSVPCWSQDSDSAAEELERSRLRKERSSRFHSSSFEVHIDDAKLEAAVESAIRNAMRSVEATMERLEIEFEDIEID
ncbi:MAG: hypothetical protein RLN85_13005, partial [Pseudomonadales bacterium]